VKNWWAKIRKIFSKDSQEGMPQRVSLDSLPVDHPYKNPDGWIDMNFIINGEVTTITWFDQYTLLSAVECALDLSGNTGRRNSREWEVRDASGVLLKVDRTMQALGLKDGARLFLSLRVGAGGEQGKMQNVAQGARLPAEEQVIGDFRDDSASPLEDGVLLPGAVRGANSNRMFNFIPWPEKLEIAGFRDVRFGGFTQDIYGFTHGDQFYPPTYRWNGHISAEKVRDGVSFYHSVSVAGLKGEKLNIPWAKEKLRCLVDCLR
jgi:hypothetical protein